MNWPCPGCGANGPDDNGVSIELWLSHTCGTPEASIAMNCPYCSNMVCINWADGWLECSNGHKMRLERALREVNRFGEALTAFGAELQAAIAEREASRATDDPKTAIDPNTDNERILLDADPFVTTERAAG